MKKSMGISTVILIGLGLYLLTKQTAAASSSTALQPALAATLLPGNTYPSYPSQYDLMHTTVPITVQVEKNLLVFTSFDQYQEVNGG